MNKIILMVIAFSAITFAKYSGGSGTSGDPWQIANTDDLIDLSTTSTDWSSTFIQTANITFDADEQNVDWDDDGTANWDAQDQLGFSPIGNVGTKFTGTYDGQEYEISNLFIDRSSTDDVGLFGFNNGATIENLGVVDCDISGKDQVGGLLGFNTNSSTVTNSYSTGAVDGTTYVGGLVGAMTINSIIENSYSTGAVTGGDQVGGLVGTDQNGSIEYCYSVGTVTGSSNVGGFIGLNVGETLTANYWKTDNGALDDTGSGTINNINETSDADMKLQATYSGWDFTNVWSFVSGVNNDYPVLSWRYPTPSITTTAITNITSSSASFSADVAGVGAAATFTFDYGTASGDYSLSYSNTIAGNSATVNVGFEDTENLMANTQYFVRASATNSASWTESEEISFWTLSEEPNQITSLIQSNATESTSEISLSWTAVSDNYLVLETSTSTDIESSDLPVDGTGYSVTNSIGNLTVVGVTTSNTYKKSGLDKNQSFKFVVIPYNTGSVDATNNYNIESYKSITGETIPTLGEWGMIVFGGLMLIGGVWLVRRVV